MSRIPRLCRCGRVGLHLLLELCNLRLLIADEFVEVGNLLLERCRSLLGRQLLLTVHVELDLFPRALLYCLVVNIPSVLAVRTTTEECQGCDVAGWLRYPLSSESNPS